MSPTELRTADPFAAARQVADTVLYEGYVLYPYRASSAKNVTRWQFGVLMPPAYAAADTSERSACRTEIVFEARAGAVLTVRVRYLHVVHRSGGDAPEWDETAERELEFAVPVADLRAGAHTHPFDVPVAVEVDGDVRRTTEAVAGAVVVRAEDLPGPYAGAARLSVAVENRTPTEVPSEGSRTRDLALRGALVAAHTMLALERGRFLSMTDHPEWATGAVASCDNVGTWPVLAGPAGPKADTVVLSSPIILGDHPEIAPESQGDLYDATEIDEILTLRTMVLTDAEKAEARATDPRAAALIDRIDGLPPEHLDRLHGALRYLRHATGPHAAEQPAADPPASQQDRAEDGLAALMNPAAPWWDPGADASVNPETDAVLVDGVPVRRGSRVRLRPGGSGRRTDAQDLFLAGRTATVDVVLLDVVGSTHVGVTPDDDDELAEVTRWHGRYLYFAPDEIEPVAADEDGRAAPSAADVTIRRMLVAGVGNIFLGDDGFGVEVIRALGARAPAAAAGLHVDVQDIGIRGVHLAYQLLDGYDVLVVVDAAPRGHEPGTVSLLRVDQSEIASAAPAVADGSAPLVDAHGLEPGAILQMLGSLGGAVETVLVLACEPLSLEEGIGLTPVVAAAVQPAADLLERLITDGPDGVAPTDPASTAREVSP